MNLSHACFISFPRGDGKDTVFAEYFFLELKEALATIDKKLSIFKFDKCEDRRRGDDWTRWIQRELCSSAMMFAICSPNYFNGSPGCVSEFHGMEELIRSRTQALGKDAIEKWLICLRLKDTFPMPALKNHPVYDFLDCCSSPEKIRRIHKHRKTVEQLADNVYKHWQWLQEQSAREKFSRANICQEFRLPSNHSDGADSFPINGGVR